MTMHDVVILAAGGSTRLGTAKQALRVQGETLLARVLRLAASTGPMSTVVVRGAHLDEWPPMAPGVTALHNADWQSGMASSLRRAAGFLAGRPYPALILVVDQPALAASHLQALLHAFDGSNDVVTAYASALGVPALVRAGTLARASELEGDQGLKKLWHATTPVSVQADELGFDLDTPDDVARARAQGLVDAAG